MIKKKLLIGTTNPAKLARWKNNFPEFETVSPQDLNLTIEVEEGLHSLVENAEKKALIYAKMSGVVTLSDDSGFYIPELGGLPGVAVRRWGGQLPNTISDEEWFVFFKEQVQHLKDTAAYFDFAKSVATPDGRVETIRHRIDGYIDKKRLENPKQWQGYPIAGVFVRSGNTKAWSEMTWEERAQMDAPMIEEVKIIVEKFWKKDNNAK